MLDGVYNKSRKTLCIIYTKQYIACAVNNLRYIIYCAVYACGAHIHSVTQHIIYIVTQRIAAYSQHICAHYAVYLVHVHAAYTHTHTIIYCVGCRPRSIFVCLAVPPLIKTQQTAESLKDPGDIITYAYHAAQASLTVLSYILF